MALIISAAAVTSALGYTVTEQEVQLAQDVLEGVLGVDLASATPGDRFIPADLRRLELSVQWETAYLKAHPEVLTQPANVQSASANGASVTFLKAGGDDGLVAPLALRNIRRLSWRRRVKTTSARRLREGVLRSQDLVHDVGRQPWVPL